MEDGGNMKNIETKEKDFICICGHGWPLKKEAHPYLCHECGFDSETHAYNFPALDAWKKSQIDKGDKPYLEERNENILRRTFSKSVNESELTWHRDKADRIVIVLNESDWYLQFDNELPNKLNLDEEYFIPKNTFHRVIKGSNDLVVEIIETEFETDEYEVYEVLEEGKKKKKKKKKDACYYKVRSRYDVWPSAYASGALVKCRNVGAKNWGNSANESINEVVTSANAEEDTKLTKLLNVFTGFIKGKDIVNFMNKIKNVAKFNEFTLKFSKGHEGANQFIIDILDGDKKVGNFVAFIYKDKESGKQNLQIQKVEIYPEYKGKGIMKTFYQDFNEWLKTNLSDFDKFTSDFIFLYDKNTGKYDGYNMWEKLVKQGLARRLGPDDDYIPPTTPPKDGMWKIKSGYALNEELDDTDNLMIYEAKKTYFSKEKKYGLHGWFSRQGGKGKSKGWVDCNTCRKDPETGRKKCKTCGRKEGEERAKYPACRPTPSSCGTKGKGKKWGKKNEDVSLDISENISIFDKNYLKSKLQETFNQEDIMDKPMIQPEVKPAPDKVQPIAPSRKNKPFLPIREVTPNPKASK